MKNLAVARRYAKALMLIGKEDGLTDQYKAELDGLVGLFNTSEDLEKALTNPLFNKQDRKNILTALLGKTELSKIMQSFLVLLFDKNRIGSLREIQEYYSQLADELQGIVKATLVSATELSSDAVDKIKEGLSKRIGKEIVLDVEQDSGLIGGVVTKIGDLVLDGSVKTQLLNMRESLQ